MCLNKYKNIQLTTKINEANCITHSGRFHVDDVVSTVFLWYTDEHSTYTSTVFVKRLVKYFKFKINTIQTDNGMEFTNRLSWIAFNKDVETMFKKTLRELGTKHKLIKPHTPKQNGKVERSHRKDQERFYYNKVFYCLEDLKNRGKAWMKEYNNFPMKPLNWLNSNEMLKLNVDKFKVVSKVFENAIFTKDEFIIDSLSNIKLSR